jgi:hypothetical protein
MVYLKPLRQDLVLTYFNERLPVRRTTQVMSLKKWLCRSLLAAVSLAPVFAFAGTNDAADPKSTPSTNAATTADPAAAPATPNPNPTPSVGNANVTALLGVLVMKGVLAPTEANAIRNAAPDAEFQLLVEALSRKGLLTAADLSAAASPAPQPSAPAPPAAVRETVSSSLANPDADPAAQAGHPTPSIQGTQPPPPSSVVPAIAPLRVIAADPPKKDGLNAAFKMGPVKMTPYGFIKATAIHDSSAPDGDDFPFIGLFLNSTNALSTGPTQDPEFHIKARSTRIGANLEWPDSNPHLTITGRIEADFEGMFSTVDNRDITSIRNPSPQLRLAYVRTDYAPNDNTDVFFEGGQDWSIFGSTALPNILETTFLGAFYGDIYTRSPQFMGGLVQRLSGSVKLLPTVAIMMPSSGEIDKLCNNGASGGNATCLAGYENQLGQGERQGADADRPEYEARLALQWQLDKAPGVAPAQVFWSGFHSRRTSIVPNASYLCDGGANPLACSEEAAFPNGFQTSSKQYGNQIAVQLPTRWFTLVASGYKGGDLRFFLGGQVSSFVNDSGGLSGVTSGYLPLDGVVNASGAPALGCNVPLNTAGVCPSTSNVVIVPQRPMRGFGGFVNLGLPISRWFNADPKGHNAGWQIYLHAGKDQAVHRDLINPNFSGSLPLLMGKMFAATLYYKLNPYCTFGIEQSVYGTRLVPGVDYTIAGSPDNLWQDHRTEFGPIFTF